MNLLRLLWRINELTMNYYYIATRLLANFQHFSTEWDDMRDLHDNKTPQDI